MYCYIGKRLNYFILVWLMSCISLNGIAMALCDGTAPDPSGLPGGWAARSTTINSITAGSVNITYGEPGAWQAITSVIDNNCGDNCPDGEPSTGSYSQTTGKDIQFCIGVGVEIIGISVNASGCYTYSTSSTTTVSFSVSAGACAARKKTAYHRQIPVTATLPLTCDVTTVWRLGMGVTETSGTFPDDQITNATKYSYMVTSENVSCEDIDCPVCPCP